MTQVICGNVLASSMGVTRQGAQKQLNLVTQVKQGIAYALLGFIPVMIAKLLWSDKGRAPMIHICDCSEYAARDDDAVPFVALPCINACS